MGRYVAFLRAINVAGHATVRMEDLRAAFGEAGCDNVRSYIQSGNVLFDVPSGRAKAVLERIPSRLAPLTGGAPTVIFRTFAELARLAHNHPFGRKVDRQDLKLYVVFLAGEPEAVPRWPLRLAKEKLEAIGMDGGNVFVVSGRKSNGFFGFPNEFIEKSLGVEATSRNLNTVRKIAALTD